MARIASAFDVGKAFGPRKLLCQCGDLNLRLIDVTIHPIPRRLVGGKAGDALDLFLSPCIARQPGGEGKNADIGSWQ